MNLEERKSVFLSSARSMIGVRWKHRGRKRYAVDCAGLLVLCSQDAGFPIKDCKGYGREPWDDLLRKQLQNNFEEPVPKPWLPGDVALIRWGQGEPTHIAIIADYVYGGLSLIHCENLNGVIEHNLSGYYNDVILEAYRPWQDKFFP